MVSGLDQAKHYKQVKGKYSFCLLNSDEPTWSGIQFWVTQYKTDMNILESVQQRATEDDIGNGDRLRALGLLANRRKRAGQDISLIYINT